MVSNLDNFLRWLFNPRHGPTGRLVPRWIFLRALALIYFSAFYSLLFQIKGLIGPEGILPAQKYLAAVARSLAGDALLVRAVALLALGQFAHADGDNMDRPARIDHCAFSISGRGYSFFVCFVCFLVVSSLPPASFPAISPTACCSRPASSRCSLLHAECCPAGAAHDPPSRASLFLLQWEWFRIYFESGIVKLLSGDLQWRNFTAMDEYYQNGLLPTWIGWYVEHLPHWFHAATAAGTLVMELAIVFMLFFPRRVRIICFFIVTPWEIGVILTANYTFLNYLVLSLGFLLLDDDALRRFVPVRFRPSRIANALKAAFRTDSAADPHFERSRLR